MPPEMLVGRRDLLPFLSSESPVDGSLAAFANEPVQKDGGQRLVPLFRAFLQERLPE